MRSSKRATYHRRFVHSEEFWVKAIAIMRVTNTSRLERGEATVLSPLSTYRVRLRDPSVSILIRPSDVNSSRPISAIKRAVMDGFGDVIRLNLVGVFEVGDRAADFQDAIVGTGGQSQAQHGELQHRFALRIYPAVASNQARRHGGI